MAKRRRTRAPSPEEPTIATTADLACDAENPRRISDSSAAGLRSSLKRFGDLSGIVYNASTNELVTGHQRMAQIREEYGDRDIECIDLATGLYGIRIDADHYFPVRYVEWSRAKQRAANVAANNQNLHGEFTGELSAYLSAVEAELAGEMPGVLEDCLMTSFLAAAAAEGTAGKTTEDVAITESYQLIVECNDEEHQKRVYERLVGEGLVCRVLTI